MSAFSIYFKRVPLQVTLVALVLYTLTVSRGVTLNSLPLTAKVAGWDSLPMTSQPLLWLLTLPLRLLPAGWAAPALNEFAAVCGALVLGLLARSLEMMDWDRPLALLGRRLRKLPIVLGCGVCGLEFNFWQESAAATGEMLQCLMFATAVFCLLQFRLNRNFRWLKLAALVWGAGMADNWMMIYSLPFFTVAALWLGGGKFLNRRSLLQLTVAGAAGFSIFFLLPLGQGLAPGSPWGFIETWQVVLKTFKHLLVNIYLLFWGMNQHRVTTLGAILFFLAPLLPCIYQNRDLGTFDRLPVDQFQVWIHRALRLGLLLVCLWLAFDPVIGPRQLLLKQLGHTLPFLSLDFLLGLGAGFLVGNLLLALHAKPVDIFRPPNPLEWAFDRAATPFFAGLSVLVFAGLLFRSTPAIALANRQPLEQFGAAALRCLPSGGGIVLSDDPQRLYVFEAAAAKSGHGGGDWLAVNSRLLPDPFYRRQLAARYPADWLTNLNQGVLNPLGMVKLVDGLARSHDVYYLHPSFNCLSDLFYNEPSGLVYRQKAYADKAINVPSEDPAALAGNRSFWDQQAPRLAALQQDCAWPAKAGLDSLGLKPVSADQTRTIAGWYAASLDDYGVRLQRAGSLDQAGKCFATALGLNPQNTAASLNQAVNTNLAAHAELSALAPDSLLAQLGNFPTMAWFIINCGPVDEPAFCTQLGAVCFSSGLERLAIQQFERAAVLAPSVVPPQMALIRLYTRYGYPEKAQTWIHRLRALIQSRPDNQTLDSELSVLEANLWLAQTNRAAASGVLQSLWDRHPDDRQISALVAKGELVVGAYTNALPLVRQLLADDPDNLDGLYMLAGISVKLGRFTDALPVIDRALTLTNQPAYQLVRAEARLGAGQLAAAETDYLELHQRLPDNLSVCSGLAEIAWRRHDTNQARVWLEKGQASLPPNDPQRRWVTATLARLKAP